MDNTKKLTKLIAENPNVEVVFMYPEEHSDHSYTFGKMYKVELDEYVLMDEKVWWKSNETSLFEEIADAIADDFYSYTDFPLSEEQGKEVNKKAEEIISKTDWEKSIVVYIQPK